MNSNTTNSLEKYRLSVMMVFLLMVTYLNVGAQNTPENQTYSVIISETCKERSDGGCWIVGYAVLSFEKDSVLTYNRIRGNCHPIDSLYDKDFVDLKKFSWYQLNDTVYIRDFDQFGDYIIHGDKLIGNKNNGEDRNVPFLKDNN